MEFKRYPSIENSYQVKTVAHIIEAPESKQDWIVHEKIHGANFAFYFNGDEVRRAKRSSFLGEESNFFGSKEVYNRYQKRLKDSFKLLKNHVLEDVSYFILYGELYGGGPHPDLDKPNSHKMIQKEIWYRPDHDFIAFDLCAVLKDGTEQYLPWNTFVQFCECEGIKYPPQLFKGTLQECLQYPNEFYPYNPFDFSELDKNICEGTVIRSVEPFYLPNGKRAILKNKNDKFMEVKKVKNKEIQLPDSFEQWSNTANYYVNQNRLNSVLSKMDEITSMKQIGEVIKSFTEDWQNEFYETYPELKEYPKKDLKLIFRMANNNGIKLIKEWFANNVRK